ncbi:MAG: DNA repair protein RecN [Deltaproteobacteria bacterium]|jgi:DNA repair protein RecN (Recombination protein N)|nr:DNA repair protein RecN [Deltaproteobacteria bacterium]
MLSELKVSNLALIKSLTLCFAPGANILTGETGAGKSILAGALGLVRGMKGSTELIRAGEAEMKVEALFQLERPQQFEALFGDLDLELSSEVIVQRSLSSAGRNRIRINGAMATLSQLAAFGEELLAVSSQHDQQSLVKEQKQLDFLDSFGQHQDLLAQMAVAYREREQAAKSLNVLKEELKDAEEKRELYEFQLKEIEQISPKPGEDQQLLDIKVASKSSGKLVKILEDAELIIRGDRTSGLLDRLEHLSHLLTKASALDERLTTISESALECVDLFSDLCANLAKHNKDQPSAVDIDKLDDRLSAISRLKRKYGPSLEEVLAKAENIRATLSRLDSANLEVSKRAKELAIATEKTHRKAIDLRQARKLSAERLTENLVATLKVLGFPKLTMAIELTSLESERQIKNNKAQETGENQKAAGSIAGSVASVVGSGGGNSCVGKNGGKNDDMDNKFQAGELAGPKGADRACFMFCPNPGEGLKPLSKIASGGELSRLMLALKIAQEPRNDQSLLFDEIDSGLSGATAEAVAAKMKELAGRQQIFVITHLPQMASLPGRHFQALKSPDESGDRTETSINELDDERRTTELARMLDGASPSPEALALSRRLLGQ